MVTTNREWRNNQLESKDQMKSEFEKLQTVLDELRDDPRPKIVEGKKDRAALHHFGIKNIKMIHGNALRDIPVKISQDVILLTDFDRKGRMLAGKLYELFRNEGFSADLSYRKELRRLARLDVIEELVSRYDDIKDAEITGRKKMKIRRN